MSLLHTMYHASLQKLWSAETHRNVFGLREVLPSALVPLISHELCYLSPFCCEKYDVTRLSPSQSPSSVPVSKKTTSRMLFSRQPVILQRDRNARCQHQEARVRATCPTPSNSHVSDYDDPRFILSDFLCLIVAPFSFFLCHFNTLPSGKSRGNPTL
jgi:hypothetical protein